MASNNVFYDLDIFPDHIEFLESYEQCTDFSDAVLAKVKELEAILDEKATPVSKIEDKARKDFKDNPAFKNQFKETFGDTFLLMYEAGESLPFPVIIAMIDELRKLAVDLENTIHDRAKRESLTNSESINDKKMAQVMHKRIRDVWDNIRAIAKMMFKDEDDNPLILPVIKARPGNYAAAPTKTYAFFFEGNEEPFYMHPYVAKKLGIYRDKITYMDVVEYAFAHPELVTVKEVML
jgi:hypothetical protein